MRNNRNSTAINAIYQTIYQVLTVITPLITSPHISRVLGANNLGIFTMTYATVSYFLLVSMLGVVNYGTRTIANTEKSKKNISYQFANIYCVQFVSSVISLILYILYIFYIRQSKGNYIEIDVAKAHIFWLLGALLDVNWFFFGIEDFKLTVTRNIIIKISTVLFVVFFVQPDHNPLIIYTLIMSISSFVSSLWVFLVIKKYVYFKLPDFSEVKKSISPIMMLFIPILATSVFHTMDKTLLGVLGQSNLAKESRIQLGYYYNADKIINIPLGVITGLGTVFLPKASVLFATGDNKQIKGFLNKTFEVNAFLVGLLSFGIAGCAREFVPWFFGAGYDECIILCYLFVPVLLVKSISSFYRMQYLIPNHLEKVYIIATLFGAVTNLFADVVLIPKSIIGIKCAGLGATGAVLGTLVAELMVMIVQIIGANNKSISNKWLFIQIKYIFIGIIMCILMRISSNNYFSNSMQVLCEVFVGLLSYLVLCILCWKFINDENDVYNTLKVLLLKGKTYEK